MSVFSRIFNKKGLEIDKNRLPEHIAIIMDGNGRWAKQRGLSRSVGHREGSNALKRITEICSDIGIKYLTVYAFSTDNWKRPQSEVDNLMQLLMEYLKKAETELAGKDNRIRVLGNKRALSQDMQAQIKRVEKLTEGNRGMCLNIALNYGGREEIFFAVKEILKEVSRGRLKPENVTQEDLMGRLYTAGIPDPDLMIRSSGEKRISNFLLWQAAYTEFWYTDVLWPDFRKEHILQAIAEYQRRNRRFGGI